MENKLALPSLTWRHAPLAVALCAMATVAPVAPAQPYPSKPIRLVVPVAPGGNLDLVGRAVAQRFTESFGRPTVVENRAGGNATIGSDFVARAAPDGYNLLMVAPTFVVAPILMRNPPFHPARDFAGVGMVATLPLTLIVHPSLPVKSVRELIALAKSKPGELNYGSSGAGSGSHTAMELFSRQAGVRLTRIPFSGDSPALVQLLGGQVSLKFDNLSTSLPLIRANRVRALGVTTATRTPLLPDVPPIADTLPGYEASIFNGVVAPLNTPRDLLLRLNAEITRFTQSPENRAHFAQQGVELQSSATPEQFTAFIKAEYDKMARLVREAGITPE